MKRILILEDEALIRNMVKQLIEESEVKADVYDFDNVKEAYQCALEKQIDCFIADIILDTKTPGDTSGLKFVESIRKIKKYTLTPVIMLTSLQDMKYCTYDVFHVYSFVEKPFAPERLKHLIEECFGGEKAEAEKHLFFHVDGIIMTVELKDFVYAEKQNRGMLIHTNQHGVLKVSYKTLKALLEEAACDDLIQCSRFCVVNRNYIESYDSVNCMIQLKNNHGLIDVGGRYKRVLEEGYFRKC